MQETRRCQKRGCKRMIKVVCGVVICNRKILIAQNPPLHKYSNLWELPGGKIEEDETPFEAIVRELKEELAMCVTPLFAFEPILFSDINLSLQPIICSVENDQFELFHHVAARWIELECLREVNWAPTDWVLVERILLKDNERFLQLFC